MYALHFIFLSCSLQQLSIEVEAIVASSISNAAAFISVCSRFSFSSFCTMHVTPARLSVTKDVTKDASLTYLPASFAGCARYEASCYCSSKCDRGHCGNKLYCVFGNCNWETASRSSVIYQSILYASRRSCCSLAWGLMGSH